MSRDRIESWRADDGADRHRAKDRLPRLAMDGKTLLDAVQDGCFVGKERSIVKKKTTLTTDELTRYVGMAIKNQSAADRYWARCMGRDAAMVDDETVARIKEFLSDKLSDKDHTKLCSMLDGESEAQDEPPPDGTEPPAKFRGTAEDAKADFFRMFPDASRVRVDNSGIPHRQRAASFSADSAASFAAMFPDAMRIKVL